MDTQRLIRLFGISFTAACLLTTSQGINIEMPRSVKAVVGSCVLVPCQTQSHTRVNWYKHQSTGWPVIYDEKKPLNVISEFRGRTSVPGHPSEGNCTLRIDNVRMSDGITLFPYINPESDKYYTPTVQIQPQSTTVPEISGPESPVMEGEVLNINCSILHSCPPSPPAIEWRGLSVNTTEVTTERLDTGMWVTVYTVRVNASYHQHRKEVHCRSSFGNSMTESGNLILDILYAPMNVTLNSENPTIAEHDTILLKCDSLSNPRAVSYQYLITNGKNPSQVNSSRDSLTITDVQRNFSAACAANNGIGTRWSAKTSPDIAFVSILLSDSFCLETDKMLKCVCRVEAHPDAMVTWMLNGSADLPTSVVPTITIKGNIRSYEVMLEGELAKQRPVVCVAKTPYSNTTQQMTIKAANTSFPWIPILAGVFGFLGLCGLLICCCRPKKKRYPISTSHPIHPIVLRNSEHSGLAMDDIPSRESRSSDRSGSLNMERPEAAPKAEAKSMRTQKLEEHKLRNDGKKDEHATESDPIYDNDTFLQCRWTQQEEEDIYLNDFEGEGAGNIYLNT